MIPVRSAIEEQAWLLIDNSDYGNDDDYGIDEIRRMKLRFRPLALTKIDSSSIERQERITNVMISDNLWLLRMELVVLSLEPIEESAEHVFHKLILMKDDYGFTFKAVYDIFLCYHVSEFSTHNGLAGFYRTTLFNPKIKYKASMVFELPDEIDALYFASPYTQIKEA